jgi:DNA-binding NarL/FixJ family response regulator
VAGGVRDAWRTGEPEEAWTVMQASTPLEGLNVLLVEDNFLLAEVTKDLLEERGCNVVGPVGQLDSGLVLAREAELDGAILDINLHGEFSFAIADVLRTRNIPFVFVTGYRDLGIVPCALRTAPRLDKPVNDDRLIESVSELFKARMG